MRTALVILNWNTKDYLLRWLPPLIESCRGEDAGVYVADNASSDGSVELMTEHFPDIPLIRLERNYGFTGGYNRAIASILSEPDAPEYLILINSDIEVDGPWLHELIAHMDSHPDCAVCGPKLHKLLSIFDGSYKRTNRFEYAGAAGGYLSRHGFPYCRGRLLNYCAIDRGQYDGKIADVEWVSGACFMTRSRVWKELGGLDDRFFAHMEEIDYCWRARLQGWKINCVPSSIVWHLGGGTLAQGSSFKLKLNFRNSLLMLSKNLPLAIGPKAAARRIRVRLAMDSCIAFIYCLTGHKEKAQAVKEAHKEFFNCQL